MNSLSWMIYLADVSDGVGRLFGGLTFVSGISTVLCAIGFYATMTAPDVYGWEDRDAKLAAHTKLHLMLGKTIPRAVAGFLVFGLCAGALPSKETVYAIAASEMGEQLINTPTAGKAVKALDAWLDRQIAPPADKPSHD